jgi:hypothetical protein
MEFVFFVWNEYGSKIGILEAVILIFDEKIVWRRVLVDMMVTVEGSLNGRVFPSELSNY